MSRQNQRDINYHTYSLKSSSNAGLSFDTPSSACNPLPGHGIECVVSHWTQGSVERQTHTDDEADRVVIPIHSRLELVLCVLDSFWDIQTVEVNSSLLLTLR